MIKNNFSLILFGLKCNDCADSQTHCVRQTCNTTELGHVLGESWSYLNNPKNSGWFRGWSPAIGTSPFESWCMAAAKHSNLSQNHPDSSKFAGRRSALPGKFWWKWNPSESQGSFRLLLNCFWNLSIPLKKETTVIDPYRTSDKLVLPIGQRLIKSLSSNVGCAWCCCWCGCCSWWWSCWMNACCDCFLELVVAVMNFKKQNLVTGVP